MIRVMIAGLLLVGCGSEESQTQVSSDTTLKQQYEKIYFIGAGDQIGVLPPESEAVLEDPAWVRQTVIPTGSEEIAGCSGKSPGRIRYDFKFHKKDDPDYVYEWYGVALAVGKKFIMGCYAEGPDSTELTCRATKCADI